MNLPDLLASMARKYPKQEGIVTLKERITYAQWNEEVNRLASSFEGIGFKKGDKAILYMRNTKEFLYAYFAVQRVGGITVPINARLAAPEVDYIIDHSEASMIIIEHELHQQVENLKDRQNFYCIKTGGETAGWISMDRLMEEGLSENIECPFGEEDEASILYTSGTTGRPKGVVFTYKNILTVAATICIEMTMKPSSRVLHMMPLSHSAPLHLFMAAGVYVGATHVAVPTFTPDLLLEVVEKEKITHFFGAPVAYLATAKHPDIYRYDLSSMDYWVYGGAPLSKPEIDFINQRFETEKLVCVYGLTEAGPNGTLLFPDEHHKAGSIGKRAAVNCEIGIVNQQGESVPVGETGEIVLRGEGTMKGYYKEPELTASAIQDGWLYTGDMGKQDEDGYYWIVDRKKDVIISGGVNIFPKEIENILLTHPKISDAAVIGVPNADWGETVKAYIVTEGEMEDIEAECKEFLKDKAAPYKIPKIYERLQELPRNLTGKLQKNKLREIH